MFSLHNRIALVTGGNGGLGLGMALGLVSVGATVVIAARQQSKAETALSRLRECNAACRFVPLDVTSADSCRLAVHAVIERYGRIDILINNAGMNVRKLPQELSEAEWQAVIDTNLSGAFRCAQAVYPYMKTAGRGKIVNIASMYATFGAPMVAAYAASKGGIVQLTKSLATAWAENHIQVNCIVPGWLDTDLTRAARREVEGLHEAVLNRTPAGRWGTPEDMAGVAVFLASDASNFVTGACIPVDGGYSVRG